MKANHVPLRPPAFSGAAPVDWALGKTLVHEAWKIVVYALLPDRVDSRDWMRGQRIPFPGEGRERGGHTDHWFDMVSDTGDSQVAMYSVAYLLHGSLTTPDWSGLDGDRPSLERPVPVVASDGEDASLPRGSLLYVGGDTAYPVADARALATNFIAPFDYAYDVRFGGKAVPTRPLLAIPGNHDWYDSLDGFNRVFRTSARPDPSARPRGHVPKQEASYFILDLPGGWELWAYDARDGADIDFRQRAFFDAQPPPRQLILATPSPPVAYGTRASWADALVRDLPHPARRALALWFSGDTHNYARYDGVAGLGLSPIVSLVSGLGGASLHASFAGEDVPASKLHPSVEQANRAVIGRLCSPTYTLTRPGLRTAGGVFGAALGAGLVAASGEASAFRAWLGRSVGSTFEGRASRVDGPWVLVAFVVTLALSWLVFKQVVSRLARTETDARKHSRLARIGLASMPFVLLLTATVALAQGANRTLGSVLLDLGFYTVATLLFVGAPFGLNQSLMPRRTVLRTVALTVVGVAVASLTAASALVASTSVYAAVNGSALFARCSLCADHGPAVASFAAVAAAAFVCCLIFPLIAGFGTAAAFALESFREPASSLAAIDRYGAFLRVRLRVFAGSRSLLTGFVIAVKRQASREELLRSPPDASKLVPEAELIDVFTVEAREVERN